MTRSTEHKRLADLKQEVRRSRGPATKPKPSRPSRRVIAQVTPASLAVGVLRLIGVIVLPFLACVRASVFFYLHGAGTWPSLFGGALIATVVVALYAAAIARRFRGRVQFIKLIKWVAAPTVAAWCLYGLLYFAAANAKSADVRGEHLSVHPVLRLALATAILADQQLVVTDMSRLPADYGRMGLPINDRTMHYRQRDGWVHAVDLRTNGQGAIRSRLVQFYFWSMGFSTLRHVGTADHLHVQLPLSS